MTRRGEPISSGDPLYAEIMDFLYREAELLDGGRFSEWLELLTDDVSYRVPVRVNRTEAPGQDVSEETDLLCENRASLQLRVTRLGTGFAWSETPPSRTRHVVSNIRAHSTQRDDEVQTFSYVLLYRNRLWETSADLFSAERQDILRRVEGRWRLAHRTVLLDQAVLGSRDLSIFF